MELKAMVKKNLLRERKKGFLFYDFIFKMRNFKRYEIKIYKIKENMIDFYRCF